MEFVPSKNSIWLTLLPPPETEARIVKDAGAVSTVPFVGDVIVTGGVAATEALGVPTERTKSATKIRETGRLETL